MTLPRIALFSDSYHEANGLARTTLAIEACAKRRNIPLLSVHAGPETRLVHDGSIVRLDLKRSSLLSFSLEHDLRFDLSMWRHIGRVAETVKWFAPDVLHFTGPSDVGQLGACLGHRLSIPSNEEFSVPQLRVMLSEVEDILGRTVTAEEWKRLAA